MAELSSALELEKMTIKEIKNYVDNTRLSRYKSVIYCNKPTKSNIINNIVKYSEEIREHDIKINEIHQKKLNKENFDDALYLHYLLNDIKRYVINKDYSSALFTINQLYDNFDRYYYKWFISYTDILLVSDIMHWLNNYLETKNQYDLKCCYKTIKAVRKIIKKELNYSKDY